MVRAEVTEYTDPYCTWCWGSEPILRKIQAVYGDQVEISFKMGGLVPSIKEFYDSFNDIGGADWHRQVAAHWLEASGRHGMPVDERVFQDIRDDFQSTYPACIAYKAAEFQGLEGAKRFLRRMREAAAAERAAIHKVEVQAVLAEEVGLEQEALKAAIANGQGERAFLEDLEECRVQGIRGFPTFSIAGPAAETVLLRGYRGFSDFESALGQVGGGGLERKAIIVSETSLQDFVAEHGKVALREVSEVFDLSTDAADSRLEQLKDKGTISKKRAGNGFFYSIEH